MKTNIVSKVKSGSLLISEPFLVDYYFKRSVILLPEHTEKGSMGFVFNKPLNVKINDVISDFPEFDAPLYSGGPVNNDMLYFVHNLGNVIEGSQRITKDLYWGGDFDKLKELVLDGRITPSQVRFFAGYSGWEKGQLDSEIEHHSWLIADTPEGLIEEDAEDLWGKLIRESETEHAIWGNFTENPSLN
jgi:putative transcriptional regulator